MQCEAAHRFLELDRPRSEDRSDPEFAELVVHLTQCPACRTRAAHLERIERALRRAMTEVPVPKGLKQRLLSELEKNDAVSSARKRRQGPIKPIRWPRVAIAAGTLTAACLALMIWQINRPIRTSVEEMEQIAGSLYDAQSQTWHVVDGRFEHKFEGRQNDQPWVVSQSRPPARLHQRDRVGVIPQNMLGSPVSMYCYYYKFSVSPIKAHVYALSDRQFHLETPPRMGPPYGAEVGSANGLVTVTWGEEGFTYVMVFRGDQGTLERAFSDRSPLALAAASFDF